MCTHVRFSFSSSLSCLSSSLVPLVRSCGGRCVFSGTILYEQFSQLQWFRADTNWRTHSHRFTRNGQRHENYHNACACSYNQSTWCRHSVETWTRWRDISAKQSINFHFCFGFVFFSLSKFILFYEIYFVCQMDGGKYMVVSMQRIRSGHFTHSTQTGTKDKSIEKMEFSVCLFCHHCRSQR